MISTHTLPGRWTWVGRRRVALGLLWLAGAAQPASAGMQEILNAIQQSEFTFARTASEVPFMPLGWIQERYYSNSRFEAERDGLPSVTVAQNTLGLGAVLPPYVATHDMLLLGGDLSWNYIAVKSGPFQDQSVLRLTPVAGWLHQFANQELLGAFVAPILSKELRGDGPWGYSGYGGVVGMHWFSDEFQLLYGGVYEYSFGRHAGYPYLGLQWLPTPRCSLSLVYPWPTVTYAPADRWILQLGVGPGGTSWVQRGDGYETTESLASWNLTAGVGYRFYEKLWLFAGGGVAGLRGFEIESDDHQTRFESRPGPSFTVAIQFRP